MFCICCNSAAIIPAVAVGLIYGCSLLNMWMHFAFNFHYFTKMHFYLWQIIEQGTMTGILLT